jgi:hypothetical protein
MKIPEGPVAIGTLIAFSAWLFIGLPIYLGPLERIQYYENAQAAPQSTAAEPNGTPQAPFFVQVIPSSKTAAERTQEAEDREEKRAADRWLVRWTAALFAATVGLILATGVLGYFAFRQARDMEKSIGAAIKGAEAAEQSAKVAQRSARTAENSFLLEQRPWLKWSLREFKPLKISGRHLTFDVSFAFENIGKTPAMNVLPAMRLFIVPREAAVLNVGISLFEEMFAQYLAMPQNFSWTAILPGEGPSPLSTTRND